ncbi:MAG: hypothetical protein A2007_06090 [Verrucomicrobia bacterium GWC2_42_7]|nr:MAG: hypothetical protein A2007_06090 [Verrucomicrobia bacterium GWC2_42_7]
MLKKDTRLYSVNEASELIKSGNILAIHGSIDLLKTLPLGNWIGGSIPYFMDTAGGIMTEGNVFVENMTPFVRTMNPRWYDANNIPNIFKENKDSSFTYIIIPGLSEVHSKFARDVYSIKDAFTTPSYGWVSGFNLADPNGRAFVINGKTKEYYHDKILATHCDFIDKSWQLGIDIVNIFETTSDYSIFFDVSGFEIEIAIINGKKCNFNEFIKNNGINIKNPLAANYDGSLINISFKGLENNKVQLYAPVFPNVEYKLTTIQNNYDNAYRDAVSKNSSSLKDKFLTCSCILNYLYGELNGKTIKDSEGPFTFGEIAYVLLNQTLVYTKIVTSK